MEGTAPQDSRKTVMIQQFLDQDVCHGLLVGPVKQTPQQIHGYGQWQDGDKHADGRFNRFGDDRIAVSLAGDLAALLFKGVSLFADYAISPTAFAVAVGCCRVGLVPRLRRAFGKRR